MLKLYLAAHAAAAQCVEETSQAQIETTRLTAFKDAGYKAQTDYESFCTFFGDQLVHMRNLNKQKLLSERAMAEVK
jgi:hypothetical protein